MPSLIFVVGFIVGFVVGGTIIGLAVHAEIVETQTRTNMNILTNQVDRIGRNATDLDQILIKLRKGEG